MGTTDSHIENCESGIRCRHEPVASNTHPSGGGGDGRRDEAQPRPVREFNPSPPTRGTNDVGTGTGPVPRRDGERSLFHDLRQKAEADLHLGQGYYSHADVLALLDVCQAATEVVVLTYDPAKTAGQNAEYQRRAKGFNEALRKLGLGYDELHAPGAAIQQELLRG